MDEIQKLRILLPHWIEHNGEHAAEFRDYAIHAGKARERLLTATRLLDDANSHLGEALAELGGPLEHQLP